jgi:ketosteroid isomerase-like protein
VTGRDILELVARQARAWEENDFDLACQDWVPSGELVAPAGTWPYERLREVMNDFHRSFRDLQITVKNVFWSEDDTKVAIEWDWAVTRRSDGKRSLTEDGIIVDLDEGGKIRSWREYFDLSNSVENTG